MFKSRLAIMALRLGWGSPGLAQQLEATSLRVRPPRPPLAVSEIDASSSFICPRIHTVDTTRPPRTTSRHGAGCGARSFWAR